MLDFAYRNLLLFFKDKTAVILSFLAEFIIIGLYILFIRDNLLQNFNHLERPELLMDVWMMSGILGITSVSTTMGAYGIMVEDKAKKIRCDFTISPISSISLLGGYIASAAAIGLIMTFLMFVFSEIYIMHSHSVRPGADRILVVYSVLFLTTLSNSSLTLLLVSFLKSNHALASCCTILGALIGFLTGIYLPMGTLPKSVQLLVKCFPVSHSVALFRQVLMEPFIADTFGSTDTAQAKEFMEYMGIYYSLGETILSPLSSLLFLFITTSLFFLLSIWRFSREA